ncbi:MAG: dephospho-CoA kinase [Synechococcales cyanobacterium K44_A2020_017]|nr:dephospho-CoA kinase [Synechococcales cyanobacterium K32_A2020_035]MBF2095416.1 dephospho-CoA kinase [Synechococcales cyanobacterium K44_A2020_017]
MSTILPRKSSGHQRIIGLTGGIGMGKTTVSDYLRDRHHLPILDADIYAREAVDVGSPLLADIADRYGTCVLFPSGHLDRRRLGDIVFGSVAERTWIERQIHPFVRQRIQQDLRDLPPDRYPVVVVVVPLLFEARMTDLVNEIWVVRCPPQQQMDRLIQRELSRVSEGDRVDLEQIQARISSQLAVERKVDQAHVVLENASSLEDLQAQVDRALKQG